jgi:hypothetical protein
VGEQSGRAQAADAGRGARRAAGGGPSGARHGRRGRAARGRRGKQASRRGGSGGVLAERAQGDGSAQEQGGRADAERWRAACAGVDARASASTEWEALAGERAAWR